MNAQYIGIDTSCYTTSAACAENGSIVSDRRTMLRVASGERGLRQSDGVFQHVRNLAEIMPALMADADRAKIKAVAVSTRPRPEQDSYMPVFLAGKTAAITLANALDVRLIELSHQQGHVRAALYGNEQLMGKRFLGMHISGGTTEIFTVGSNLGFPERKAYGGSCFRKERRACRAAAHMGSRHAMLIFGHRKRGAKIDRAGH